MDFFFFFVFVFYTYSMLHFNIQFAGGLIQYDDLRISNQSSDDGDALLLSIREFSTAFPYICKDEAWAYRLLMLNQIIKTTPALPCSSVVYLLVFQMPGGSGSIQKIYGLSHPTLLTPLNSTACLTDDFV